MLSILIAGLGGLTAFQAGRQQKYHNSCYVNLILNPGSAIFFDFFQAARSLMRFR